MSVGGRMGKAAGAPVRCRVALLGNAGAGKTSLLASLWLLGTRQAQSEGLLGFACLDESSRGYLCEQAARLESRARSGTEASGGPSGGTEGLWTLRARTVFHGREVSLETLDYSGAQFEREGLNQTFGQGSVCEALRNLLRTDAPDTVDAVLCVLEFQRDVLSATSGAGRRDTPLTPRQAALLNTLREMLRARGAGCPAPKVALVVSKGDVWYNQARRRGLGEGRRLLRTGARSFWERFRREFGEVPVFVVSSTGFELSGGRGELVPWGHGRLFDWLIPTAVRRWRRVVRVALWAAACACVAYGGLRWHAGRVPLREMSRVERLVVGESAMVGKLREALSGGVSAVSLSGLSLSELESEYGLYAELEREYVELLDGEPSLRSELELRLAELHEALDDRLYAGAVSAEGVEEQLRLLDGYLTDSRQFRRHEEEARAAVGRIRAMRVSDWRRSVRGIEPCDRATLLARLRKASEGLSLMSSETEREEFCEIRGHLEGLLSRRSHRVVIERAEGLRRAIESRMWLDSGEGRRCTGGLTSTSPQWGESLRLSWQPGMELRLVWEDLEWVNEEIAEFRYTGLLALPWMLGRTRGAVVRGQEGFFSEPPTVTVGYPEDRYWEQESARAWRLIERYVVPGTYWSE